MAVIFHGAVAAGVIEIDVDPGRTGIECVFQETTHGVVEAGQEDRRFNLVNRTVWESSDRRGHGCDAAWCYGAKILNATACGSG